MNSYSPSGKLWKLSCPIYTSLRIVNGLTGTSMATPMVSGTVALIWSTVPNGTSASQVRTRLESTADQINGTGTYWSKGRVNAARAVAP